MLILEQEIVDALGNADVKSSDLSALIERTEAATVEVDQAAEIVRNKALDPVQSPDPKAAREAMVAADFDRDRLCTLVPRLHERLQQVQAAEYAARWEADFEQVEGRHNELAQEYAATYPSLVAVLVDLFERIEVIDKEVSRINGSAPSGEHRRLLQVELVARGLNNFSRTTPPIPKGVQLVDWSASDQLIWPPPQPSIGVLYAMSMVPQRDPRYSNNWAAAVQEDNVRRAANEARWAEEEVQRQAESRRVYEASLRR